MAISTYLGNKLLDHILHNTGYTSPTTVYVSLHTGDPGLTGANEVSGGSYARLSTTFDASSAKVTQNSAQKQFTLMPACTITHIGVWDASTVGNFLWGGALSASKTINVGDTAQVAVGALSVSI